VWKSTSAEITSRPKLDFHTGSYTWSRPRQFVRRGQTIARARPDAMAKASVDVIVAMRDPMP